MPQTVYEMLSATSIMCIYLLLRERPNSMPKVWGRHDILPLLWPELKCRYQNKNISVSTIERGGTMDFGVIIILSRRVTPIYELKDRWPIEAPISRVILSTAKRAGCYTVLQWWVERIPRYFNQIWILQAEQYKTSMVCSIHSPIWSGLFAEVLHPTKNSFSEGVLLIIQIERDAWDGSASHMRYDGVSDTNTIDFICSTAESATILYYYTVILTA